jgi:putative transcriptional regulator
VGSSPTLGTNNNCARLCARFPPMGQPHTSRRLLSGIRKLRIVRELGGRSHDGRRDRARSWKRGENENVSVTLVHVPNHVPNVDVREVRTKMGLSQAQFATKFGLPPATLRNWEQGRSRPDAPTRVLLAVIAKHPEAVEDVLRKAR